MKSPIYSAHAARLCLCLTLVACAVPEDKSVKKTLPAQSSEEPDASFDAGPVTRGAGMPNVPIHRADAGAVPSKDVDAAAVSVAAMDAGDSDSGQPAAPVVDAGTPLAALPAPIHRYSFSGTGSSVPDEQGGKDAMLQGDAMLDGVDGVDLNVKGGGDGLVALPDDTLGDLGEFSVLVWLYAYSDACWQRALDLTYTEQTTTTTTPSGPGGNMGPGGPMTTTTTRTALTSLYLTPFGCPDELPTLGYVTPTSKYHLVGKQAVMQDQEVLLGLSYSLRSQTLRLIVNGEVKNEQRILLDLHSLHRARGWLGRSSAASDPPLDGSISELRVYDSALDPDVLTQIFERGPDKL